MPKIIQDKVGTNQENTTPTVAGTTGYVLPIASATILGGIKIGSGFVMDPVTGILTVPIATVSNYGIVKPDGTSILINNGVLSGSAAYVLPPATINTLGGVMVGNGLTVASNGLINVIPYVLPTSSTTVLGGVKIDGVTVTIANGVISAPPLYILPVASNTVLGGIKVGNNLTINSVTGVLDAHDSYVLPVASTSILGGVKIDGSTIVINGITNKISAPYTYTLPIAGVTTLGGIKVGNTLVLEPDGVLNYNNPNPTVYTLPQASTAVLGGVKIDGTSIVINATTGVISGSSAYILPPAYTSNGPSGNIPLGGVVLNAHSFTTSIPGVNGQLGGFISLQPAGVYDWADPGAVKPLGGVRIGPSLIMDNPAPGYVSVGLPMYANANAAIRGGIIVGPNLTITNTTIGIVDYHLNSTGINAALGFSPLNPIMLANANGIATLDSTGKLVSGQIPASLVGAVVYQGTWDPSANNPFLVSGVGTKGWYYVCSVDGSTNLDGISTWYAKDWAIFDGTAWNKVDGNNSEVLSVFGRTGIVTMTSSDVSTALGYVAYNPNTQVTIGVNAGNLGTSAQDAVTIGTGAYARIANSIAVGTLAKALATDSIAIGTGANANQANSIAIGAGVVVNTVNTIVIGQSTQATNIPGSLTVGGVAFGNATSSVQGLVKPDNSTITISGGVISAPYTYTLPAASTTVLGGVKVDGTTVVINATTNVITAPYTYTLPIASNTVLGGIKSDGTSVVINAATGVLSAIASANLVNTYIGVGNAANLLSGSSDLRYTGIDLIQGYGSGTTTIRPSVFLAGGNPTSVPYGGNVFGPARGGVAIGSLALVDDDGIAIGGNAVGMTRGIGIGWVAVADSVSSIAMGDTVWAHGVGSIAIGGESKVGKVISPGNIVAYGNSIAMGSNAVVEANDAIALGVNSYVTTANMITLGTVNNRVNVPGTLYVNGVNINGSGSTYTLPTASSSVLGGIKIGSTLTLNASNQLNYVLPIAGASTLGGIKVGSGLTMNATSGVLSTTGGYTLPVAGNHANAVDTLGGVIVDGGTIKIAANGLISVDPSALGAPALATTCVGYGVYNGLYGDSSFTWDTSKLVINTNQIQLGYTANAYGNQSTAIMWSANAQGDYAIAIGPSAFAGAAQAISIGYASNAPSAGSMAIGWSAKAAGANSTSLGLNSAANGTESIAVGHTAIANADGALALGKDTWANSSNTITIGTDAGAGVDGAGADAAAIGRWANAHAVNSFAIGMYSNTFAAATDSISFGSHAIANAANSVAIGSHSNADAADVIAIGNGSVAKLQSVALGSRSTTNTYSVAIGYASNAFSYAVAIGYAANITGDTALGVGCGNKVNGQYAIGIGRNTNALAKDTIAIGNSPNAIFINSIAIGSGSWANAVNAVAIGAGVNVETANMTTIGTTAVTVNIPGVLYVNGVNITGASPIATTSVLGGVIVGNNLTVAANGMLDAAAPYSLPAASTTVLGGVKVDGTTITINATTNVISSAGGSASLTATYVGVGNAGGNLAGTADLTFTQSLFYANSVQVLLGTSAAASNAANAIGIGSGVVVGAALANTNAVDAIVIGRGAGAATVANTAANGAIVIGRGATLSSINASIGANSIVIGLAAKSQSYNCIVLGNAAIAGNGVAFNDGIAIGRAAFVNSGYGLAIGWQATISAGGNSIVIGTGANSNSAYCISLGANATATGSNAIAIGASSISNGFESIAIGVLANGQAGGVAVGRLCTAVQQAVAMGYSTQALFSPGVAIGNAANAGQYGIAIGSQANSTSIANGTAIGSLAKALATDSIAIGKGSNVVATAGVGGIAIGNAALVNNAVNGIAIGTSSVANAANAVAIGLSSSASAEDGVALGKAATASSADAIAIGGNAVASAANSVAIGYGAASSTANMMTLGVAATTVNIPGTLTVAGVPFTSIPKSYIGMMAGTYYVGNNTGYYSLLTNGTGTFVTNGLPVYTTGKGIHVHAQGSIEANSTATTLITIGLKFGSTTPEMATVISLANVLDTYTPCTLDIMAAPVPADPTTMNWSIALAVSGSANGAPQIYQSNGISTTGTYSGGIDLQAAWQVAAIHSFIKLAVCQIDVI